MKRYTAKELEGMPTIRQGHFDNLKIETDTERVWLSRMTVGDGMAFNNAIIVEELVDGVWEEVDQYPGGEVEAEEEVMSKTKRGGYDDDPEVRERAEKLSQEIYGKSYKELPDDGAEQDYIMGLIEGDAKRVSNVKEAEEEKGYQGWSSFATWGVALIVNNDQALQEMVHELVMSGEPSIDMDQRLRDFVDEQIEQGGQLHDQVLAAGKADIDYTELVNSFREVAEEIRKEQRGEEDVDEEKK